MSDFANGFFHPCLRREAPIPVLPRDGVGPFHPTMITSFKTHPELQKKWLWKLNGKKPATKIRYASTSMYMWYLSKFFTSDLGTPTDPDYPSPCMTSIRPALKECHSYVAAAAVKMKATGEKRATAWCGAGEGQCSCSWEEFLAVETWTTHGWYMVYLWFIDV